jgi:organic radical activating enzyme
VGCHYCDTKHTWPTTKLGTLYTVADLVEAVQTVRMGCSKITITGGEPMEQWGYALSCFLAAAKVRNWSVSMETAGTHDLTAIIRNHPYVNLVVDYKMPSARARLPPHLPSFKQLRATDVVKFVVTLDEVRHIDAIARELVNGGCRARLVFSPVWHSGQDLAAFIEEAKKTIVLPAMHVGLNLQLHKFVWPDNPRAEEARFPGFVEDK